MPRTGVTQKQVAETIVELKAAGLAEPSIREIRAKLGKGSLTSITRHKQSLDAIAMKAGEERLPDQLTVGIEKVARGMWIELTRAADDIVKSKEAALERQQRIIDKKIETVDTDEAVLRSNLIERERRIKELEKALRISDTQRLAAEKKLAKQQGESGGVAALKVALMAEKRAHEQLRKQTDKERIGWVKRFDQLQVKLERKRSSTRSKSGRKEARV